MRIRQNHPIADRIKLICILLVVLWILWFIADVILNDAKVEKTSTIEYMLQQALEPVGTTMYIWGGGWDDEDSKSGAGSTKIGCSSQWKKFTDQQDATYDFEEHRFERENGLDCSGYVGWVIYNTFETESNQPGYVTTSTELAESLANRGWGVLIKNPRVFLPGDVVSMDGHVWLCLGTCKDGSVLLVHSSPPGVSLCGTPACVENGDTKEQESIAVQLATEYMATYHPEWQEKYPNRNVPDTYLESVSVFRWNKRIMSDAEEVQALSAEEIFCNILKNSERGLREFP